MNNNELLKKIGNHLYEYTLNDDSYWLKSNVSIGMSIKDKKSFGCSAVQNGYIRGRNYDWYNTDSDICVIHAPKTNIRKYASVGIADLGFAARDENDNYDISKLDFNKLPFVTVDGVNEAGMCIQVNVMPYGEYFSETVKGFYHTPTKKDNLLGAQVVRYILDMAGSIEEAIELLKQKDVYSSFNDQEELHWMISGPTSESNQTIKTIVVEYFPKNNDKGLIITEEFIEDKPIMTNFNVYSFTKSYNSFKDKKIAAGVGMGYERWQILSENFNQGNSVTGMFDLMKKVWYSKSYDLYSDRFWYSEYSSYILDNYYEDKNELKTLVDDKMGPGAYDAILKEYGVIFAMPQLWDSVNPIKGDISKTGILAPIIEKEQKNYLRHEMDGSYWITVETSIYDLKNKTLHLSVRESSDLYKFEI